MAKIIREFTDGAITETTLTDAEYDALLTERNEIRKNSNKFEAKILSKRSLNTLQSYEYKY